MAPLPRHLIFIRHGESEANVVQAASKSNEPRVIPAEEAVTYPDNSWRLTERGIQQVQMTLNFLEEEYGVLYEGAHFVNSPFTRTRETAAYIAPSLDTVFHENRTVRERSWGEIDSMTRQEFKEEYPQNYAYKERDPLYWAPPSGESIAQVAENRVHNYLKHLSTEPLIAQNNSSMVVTVTHGEFMWATRLVMESLSDEDFVIQDKDPQYKIHNAAVLEYRCNGAGDWFSRMSYPIVTDNDSRYHVGQWQKIEKNHVTAQNLRTLAEQNPHRIPTHPVTRG